jgi:Ca-activated chloride channel family protein
VDLPQRQGTVILAFDVSSSMKAKDLKPTRMAAAKQAARAFVADQPSSIRIGVVAFSDAGYVVQAPTRSHDEVLAAIGRLTPRGGTALGRGILTSLGAVAGEPLALDRTALENGARQPGIHFLGSAAVVLLSDGDNTAALDPLALAPVAAQAGVRIFPIGIGSPNGAVVDIDGFQVATALDANLLRGVAKRSGGTYFSAGDATALRKVYDSIDLQLTIAGRKTEITALFAGAGLLLFLVAAGLSMRWYGRVI